MQICSKVTMFVLKMRENFSESFFLKKILIVFLYICVHYRLFFEAVSQSQNLKPLFVCFFNQWFIFRSDQKKIRAKDGVRESASERFLKIGASNTGLEKKLNMFSVTLKKTSVKKKGPHPSDGRRRWWEKKHQFPKLPKSHTDTRRLQMPFMKECTTNISIYSFWIFFLANDKRPSLLASLLFTFCLHYTFKHVKTY